MNLALAKRSRAPSANNGSEILGFQAQSCDHSRVYFLVVACLVESADNFARGAEAERNDADKEKEIYYLSNTENDPCAVQ